MLLPPDPQIFYKKLKITNIEKMVLIKLMAHECSTIICEFSPTSLVSFYTKTTDDGSDSRDAINNLVARFEEILSLNPWLTGRLVCFINFFFLVQFLVLLETIVPGEITTSFYFIDEETSHVEPLQNVILFRFI